MKAIVVFLFTAAVLLALSHSETIHRPVAKWVPASNGNVPPNAVLVGTENGNKPVYVCRAIHERDNVQGKLVPSRKLCYVPWGHREHTKQNYEVLTLPYGNTLEWISIQGPQLPFNAVQGGIKLDGGPLYIGRANHLGAISSGKVEYGALYLPFGGHEHKLNNFDVLIAKRC